MRPFCRPVAWLGWTFLLLVTGCSEPMPIGQRIFLEGRGEQRRITYTQGPNWLAYGEFGCATCHSEDGTGRSVRAGKVSGSAPPIIAAALSVRGYDQRWLRRALFEGITPAGAL